MKLVGNKKTEAVRLNQITVVQNDVLLLKDINLNIYSGEIYGILALNNLGMDKLVELLCQNIVIDYGNVYLNDKLINNHLYSDNAKTGVAVVSKQNQLIDDLTVIENIYIINSEFKGYIISNKDEKEFAKRFLKVIGDINVEIDPHQYVKDLNVFQKCVVILLKAIKTKSPLIICDYLSDFLNTNDILAFHKLMHHFKKQGHTFLYLCSHHEEAFEICDRVALLDQGRIIKKLNKNSMTNEIIFHYVENMVEKNGQTQNSIFSNIIVKKKSEISSAKPINNVNNKNSDNTFSRISRAECITLLDRDGTAFESLDKLINSLDLFDKSLGADDLFYIEENPTKRMVFPDMTYLDNLCFTKGNHYPAIWHNRRLKKSILSEFCSEIGEDIYSCDIKKVSNQSLYNLVYYRGIVQKAKVVFIKQPFSNADVILRNHILELINNYKKHGISVFILAINLSDALFVSDKLLVIENGMVQQTYNADEFENISNNRLKFMSTL